MLFRHRDFRLVWLGQAVSKAGTAVTLVALPLVALQRLHASTFEVGLLTALETLPFLLVGLPAGAWVDRLPKRRVLIVGDLGRAVALGSIPVAAALDALTYAQLAVVVLVSGVLTVFFDVASQSYLPELLAGDQLIGANGALAASEGAASVAGPGLGGALVALLGAAGAVAADATSYLASAACLWRVRARPPERDAAVVRRRLRAEVAEGLRWVLHEPPAAPSRKPTLPTANTAPISPAGRCSWRAR